MAARKSRVQSEIENFLAEVTGGSPSRQNESDRKDARRKQEAATRRKQKQQAAQQRRKAAAAALAKSKKKQGRRSVGSNISKHVAEYIDNDVEEYVEATIVDSVESHLGKRETEMPQPDKRDQSPVNSAAAEVARLLRDPKGVRNAILVNEILSRPRALRRD